ncbi:Fe-S cluster assembly protein SufD [Solimonas sp. K1W22B-7]|uniref:Fe-S cluster assembly protein SufD n=1 Tax=Solimonas sp. K1W22B-7 TaxID=2303331 RepID=UPI000E3330A9|nr:Fe-S cluster assembly protein SufD [Solimonas sp. K1W22B-7]AXQ29017.1 Fe-S cluster assembly protein SufD [Solimonas sp. K1W22B-7]
MLDLDTFRRAFEALPAPARTDARRKALDAFLAGGLPSTDLEEWKYTDLAPFAALSESALNPEAEAGAAGAGFSDALDALNAAFAGGASEQRIAANTQLEAPIRPADRAHQRHRLHLERGSEATLILNTSGEAVFQTIFADIRLDAGARLHLIRVNDAGADAHRLTRINLHLARDACADVVTIDLGGRLSRHDLNVDLAEPGASIHMHGLYAPAGNGHVDNHTRIEHRAPHCSSREQYRGIARDKARGVFNGMIRVHKDAQKTDSEQRIANLILSPGAEINAKPELEIYADDVKCAHGATFGQLDDEALFYLRSRGLPEATARALLTWTFAHEILQHIRLDDVRSRITKRLLRQLPDTAQLEALQ